MTPDTTLVIKRLAPILAVFLMAGCATTVDNDLSVANDQDLEGAKLHALFDDAWEHVMRDNPTWASGLGDMRFNDRWPDVSAAARAQQHTDVMAILDKLDTIDVASLSSDDQLNYTLFKQTYEEAADDYQYRRFLIPLNQRGGIQSANGIANRIPFRTVQHYEDWIARLNAFGTYMDQTLDLMRQGIEEGMVHPRIIMERLPAQIQSQIKTAEESPFYSPFNQRPDSIDEETFAALTSRGKDAIATVVVPAYERMADFVDNQYLPATRETVGVWDSPKGRAFYTQEVKNYTTTNLTPDEVHEIGLSEVTRIRGEMMKIIESLEFDGSFADFLTFLRTDPQFYHETPEALMQDYLATSKRIDPELVKLFSDLPRMPYGLKKIPDAIAPDTTTAYYSSPAADGSRAGYYFVNLYRPEVRPKYEIEVLTVHEAMPGHHLQIALAQELGDLPMFRRFGGYTAFVEGWGLYSESLGEELGLYKDPYSKFGQLTYEMWRAVRLVVDTGMHHKGWTRDQAIAFFKDNAAKAEYDIVNEIDRYIAWPGQALAYKIGELKIKELRARGETTLGDRFDIKAFHKVVLGSGAIPLSELEKNVDAWIEEASR
ncbi:MAG: DUF885 domain-containing protein [Pseudomonadota bacterium]